MTITPPPELVKQLILALTARETVVFPGIGRIQVRHIESREIRNEAGELRLLPPANQIVFDPEQR